MKIYPSEELTAKDLRDKAICHYQFKRHEVQALDFNRLNIFMKKLKKYGSAARQKILFSFDGYNDDKRELIFIPEVVKFTQELLNKQHPYLWYYAIPNNSEFLYLAMFFRESSTQTVTIPLIKKFYIKPTVEQLKQFVTALGMNLNIFGEEINDIKGATECFKVWSDKIINSIHKEN